MTDLDLIIDNTNNIVKILSQIEVLPVESEMPAIPQNFVRVDVNNLVSQTRYSELNEDQITSYKLLEKINDENNSSSIFSWIFNLPFTGIKKIIIDPFISMKNYLSSFFWKSTTASDLDEFPVDDPFPENLIEQDSEDRGQSSRSNNIPHEIIPNPIYCDIQHLKNLIKSKFSSAELLSLLGENYKELLLKMKAENIPAAEQEERILNYYCKDLLSLTPNNPIMAVTRPLTSDSISQLYFNNVFEEFKMIQAKNTLMETLHIDEKRKYKATYDKINVETIWVNVIPKNVEFKESALEKMNQTVIVSDDMLNKMLESIGRGFTKDNNIKRDPQYIEAVKVLKNYFSLRAMPFFISAWSKDKLHNILLLRTLLAGCPTLVEITEVVLKQENAEIFFPKLESTTVLDKLYEKAQKM
jgi:hypothetical protein